MKIKISSYTTTKNEIKTNHKSKINHKEKINPNFILNNNHVIEKNQKQEPITKKDFLKYIKKIKSFDFIDQKKSNAYHKIKNLLNLTSDKNKNTESPSSKKQSHKISEKDNDFSVDSLTHPINTNTTELTKSTHPPITSTYKRLYTDNKNHFFISNYGALYRYDSRLDTQVPTRIKNIDEVFLGSNKNLYARKENSLLLLDSLGNIVKEFNIQPKEIKNRTIIQTSVDSNSTFAYSLDNNGMILKQSLPNNKAEILSIPIIIQMEIPVSIAINENNDILLLTSDNKLWIKPNNKKWKRLNRDNNTVKIVHLETLLNGEFSAISDDKTFYKLQNKTKTDSTILLKEIIQQNLIDSNFDRLHESLTKKSTIDINVSTAFIDSNQPNDIKRNLKKPWKLIINSLKDIPDKFKDIKNFQYSSNINSSKIYYQSQISLFKNQINGALDFLENNELPTWSKLSKTLINDIDRRLDDYLNKTNEPNQINQHKRIKSNNQNESQWLSKIATLREQLYPNDPLKEKLKNAIMLSQKNNVLLNNGSLQLDAIITEHALAVTALYQITHKDPEDTLDIQLAAEEAIYQSLPNTLLNSRIDDQKTLFNLLDGFDGLQSIFRKQNDITARILNNKIDEISKADLKKPSISELSDSIFDIFDSMREGEVISIGKSKATGFKSDNLRIVFTGVLLTLSLGASKLAPLIMPIFDYLKLKELNFSITKTNKGATITLEKSKGNSTTIGLRSALGLIQGSNDSKLSQGGFQAFEMFLKNKKTSKKSDSITIEINDKQHSKKVIQSILMGKENLISLLKQNNPTSTNTKKTTQNNFGLGALLISITGLSRNNESNFLGTGSTEKLYSGSVIDIASDFSNKKEISIAKNTENGFQVTNTNQPWGLNSTKIGGTLASVIEFDFLKMPALIDKEAIPGSQDPNMLQRLRFYPGILPTIALAKTFSGFSPPNTSSSIDYDQNGVAQNINQSHTINNSNTISSLIKNSDSLMHSIPGFKSLLKSLNTMKGKADSINVKMSLNPIIYDSLPQKMPDRLYALQTLAKNQSNFVVNQISINQSHETQLKRSLEFPGIGREVSAYIKTIKPKQTVQIDFEYNYQKSIDYGYDLINQMTALGEGAWGVSEAKTHLIRLISQFEDLLHSLHYATKEQFHRGHSLYENYQAAVSSLTHEIKVKIHTLMTHTPNDTDIIALKDHFTQYTETLKSVRNEYALSTFNAPSIRVKGEYFDNRRIPDLKPDTDIWNDSDFGSALTRLTQFNLSILPNQKIPSVKKAIDNTMDIVKRRLNKIPDLDEQKKFDFYAHLESMTVRKTDYNEGQQLIKKLDELTKSASNKSHDVLALRGKANQSE